MTPYEILLSESQERMLVVAKKGREQAVRDILTKWDLQAEVIGEVIAEPVYRVVEGTHVVAEFPGTRLVTDCPSYSPPAKESPAVARLRARDVHAIKPRPEESDPSWTLEQLLSSPTIASKQWVYRQYDSTVRTNTVRGPGAADAAVLRIRGSRKGLGVKTDCNSRYVYLEPRTGGRIAVTEAARNVACVGARPRAITNCLNFGNPKKPEVFWQFKEAVGGMGEACAALETPVTGGNVSLYNENPSGAVYPTPTIGMVGVLNDAEKAMGMAFPGPGRTIVLLGEPTDELGASEYLATIHGITAGAPPACDLARERALIETILELIGAELVESAHDCSEGGLGVALAECCVADRAHPVGATVDLSPWTGVSPRAVLFGEAQGRIVVSTTDPKRVQSVARGRGVPATVIGKTTAAAGGLTISGAGKPLRISTARMVSAYHESLERVMSGTAPQLEVPA
jgi:phosphoribosylformylglycinamidine synthase